ncbi:MAG: ABC transporter ATP-binding protein [Candidatus Omnitrophica bacterium]|nr:ABC transporter ATP-binding protein [Candidatus Omnitrophota bacterium]
MAKSIFELREAYFSYPGKIPALCGINLDIEEGSRVAIIGSNGTGKSTLLLMLDALLFPHKGTIKFLGKELKEALFNDPGFTRSFRSRVGFVFQNSDIQLFCPTVKEDIIFGPLQLGISQEQINRRLDKIIGIFNIAHLLPRPGHRLSAGEKKKVALASVLIIEPQVLLLDEPTAGLDPQTIRNIIDIILEFNQTGKTIITATHDLHIVEEIAGSVHILGRDKNIIRTGAPVQILSDQDFLRENNLTHIHSHRHQDTIHTHPHLHTEHHH